MSDETENNETPEKTPVEETPAAEAPAEETPAAEAPAEETPAAEAPAEETPAEEAPAVEEPVAEEVGADEVEATAADEAVAEQAAAEEAPEPVAPLTSKDRKVASRARRGRRRGATPEERAEERKAKAVARRRRRLQEREKARAARAEAGPAQTTPPKEHGPGRPKTRQGTVVSDKADKTITVRIDTARRHRKYEKIVRSSSTLHAHDEANEAGIGDTVRVVESRPLSALKRWKLVEVLEKAK
jgi:small subunit ribosomal protein S17